MADPSSSSPPSALPPRNAPAPSSSFRRRALPTRAATFVEGSSTHWPQRRNSTLSDSISEARHSIRSSTDDLFLPRVGKDRDDSIATEESHWQSAPLVLALLPAIAGIFFRDGSLFMTDVTLLVLAAIFLNWSVRLPWDWYRSAQAIQREHDGFNPVAEELAEANEDEEAVDSHGASQQHQKHLREAAEAKAIRELQIHELVALASCFIFPVIGTWLLHSIRSSLSRPSEGLVSNYNLTIFLLASEVRPFAHLLKLGQARTLYLQRIVASSTSDEEISPEKVQDLSRRLDELEAHVAEAAAARLASSTSKNGQSSPSEDADDALDLISQAVVESRRVLSPDIEALNRAVRRYEKRTALTTMQTDTRFQQVEAQARDAIALAAAAQRSTLNRRQSYAFILIDWACGCIVVPAQLALSVLNLPGRVASHCILAAQQMFGRRRPSPQPRPKGAKDKSRGAAGSKIGPPSTTTKLPAKSPAISPLGGYQQQQSFESVWSAAR
ncbi:uncharacterized protein N7482_003015 [Penicillium canariense]|uniref:Uncharacterized protein n=1 Tax=Penicillium canariense TaxID=189055 RepID=A0A9W9LUF9_9EURO|nr:uncharacterized protein N7482_003015 [Penicillium canariense]KAJ5177138.1 hypothetical protein N7482_003015 [Penicillium canariense]